jgi:hypothetical protein
MRTIKAEWREPSTIHHHGKRAVLHVLAVPYATAYFSGIIGAVAYSPKDPTVWRQLEITT